MYCTYDITIAPRSVPPYIREPLHSRFEKPLNLYPPFDFTITNTCAVNPASWTRLILVVTCHSRMTPTTVLRLNMTSKNLHINSRFPFLLCITLQSHRRWIHVGRCRSGIQHRQSYYNPKEQLSCHFRDFWVLMNKLPKREVWDKTLPSKFMLTANDGNLRDLVINISYVDHLYLPSFG